MEVLEAKIQEVQLEIKGVAERERLAEKDSDISYLRRLGEQLRKEEEQLREERLILLRRAGEGEIDFGPQRPTNNPPYNAETERKQIAQGESWWTLATPFVGLSIMHGILACA